MMDSGVRGRGCDAMMECCSTKCSVTFARDNRVTAPRLKMKLELWT